MKVFFLLIGNNNTPSVRERVLCYFSCLKNEGVKISVHMAGYIERGIISKAKYYAKLLKESTSSDIVFIHRLSLTQAELNIIHSVNNNVVFDFDDAIFTDMDLHGDNENVKNTISKSSLLVVGNKYLSDCARTFNNNVVILPTCVDTDLYKPDDENKDSSVITIGWIGLSTNLRYLTVICDALREIASNNKNVVLKIVSDAYIDIPGVEIIRKQWCLEEEVTDLQTFDIGIMPLTDDTWTRGKCSFKALLYMAVGIPVVLSPVGANKEVVTDGVEGYFADSKEEWVTKLSRLINDKKLRKSMGEKGRESVTSKYSKQIGFSKFLGAIKLLNSANG